MSDTQISRLLLENPGDVAELVPYLVGFTPEESLVIVAIADTQVQVTARADLTDMQQQDAVRPQRRQIKVVQHRANVQMTPTGQGFQQAQQMLLVIEIHRRRGFIKEQPAARRAVAPKLSQRAGELDALLLAAGECGKLPARQR